MRQEAEKYADYDRKRMEMIEIRNQSDSLFYTHEITLKENEHLIEADLRQLSEQKRQQLEIALRDASIPMDKLRIILEEFRQSVLEIGTRIYTGRQQENFGKTGYESLDPTRLTTGARKETLTNLNTNLNTNFRTQTSIDQKATQTYTGTKTYSGKNNQLTDTMSYDDPYDAEETIASDYEAVD
jgi:molecular chaperone DnaK